MRTIYALLFLCACSTDSLTTIHVDVSSDAAWKVHITIGPRAPIDRPLEPVEIVVPDDMAGVATPIEISASSTEIPVASGRLDVTPVLHDDVFYTLALQPLSCGSACTIGAKQCSGNGIATCERQPNGCGAWAQPVACAAPAPFCSDGACTSTFEVQVASGAFHSCALRSDGSVVCWGLNDFGQSTVPAGTTFKSIVAGGYYTCGMLLDNTIKCWGESIATTPPPGAFDKMSAGAHHACARRADNTFACWGDSTKSRYAFPETKYLDIAAGSEHSCAIKLDGTLACVGDNTFAQVSPLPTGTFTRIDAGDAHACAMRANGTLACWGYTISGTPPATAFDVFATGSTNSCGIAGTTLSCWGNDQYGQTSMRPTGSFRSLALGARHGCAVRTDKSVVCWGSNAQGQTTVPAL